MINTAQWVSLLNQQYDAAASSGEGLDLLLAVRQFVRFLDADPRARRFSQESGYQWETKYQEWFAACQKAREQLLEIERGVRATGAMIEKVARDAAATTGTEPPGFHILAKIAEEDWYRHWDRTTDVVSLELLHLERPPQTQTGFMIANVLGIARQLAKLAAALGAEEAASVELREQAQRLWRQYGTAQRRLKYDWMSSGKCALEQLRVVTRIVNGGIFEDAANYGPKGLRSLSQWATFVVGYAPPDLRHEIEVACKQFGIKLKDFQRDLDPLIRLYLRRLHEELQTLAASRFAHEQVVDRYKVRCENYDSRAIEHLIEGHVKETGEGKFQFEDLLTLHLARYLYDSGYAVHYRLRGGAQEPDLLARVGDLEPIVVEAKIVGQEHGTSQGKEWILQGLRALHSYVEKLHSEYGVADGYLVVFRIGDTGPMYTFEPQEWPFSQFVIIPRVINLGKIDKKAAPEVIRQKDVMGAG
jgi:hypothetical protein